MSLKPYEQMEYFDLQEKLVDVLVEKTQNADRQFFRILTAYHLTKMASSMRAKIKAPGLDVIPVNFYGINLAPSGAGKGHSTSIIERNVINQFKKEFTHFTLPRKAQDSLQQLAISLAPKHNMGSSEMLEKLEKQFRDMGAYPYSFDSGTSPAVKQLRQMLLMSGCGSINFEVDEIGSNLVHNLEVLNLYLELFDLGQVKQKITKNTAENIRNDEIDGATPANMMLYGTPVKLLNGDKTEYEYLSMLETGFARRAFFSYLAKVNKIVDRSPEELFDLLTNNNTDQFIEQLSDQFAKLADPVNLDFEIQVDKPVMLKLLEYRQNCEAKAAKMRDYEEIQKAELSHRWNKVLKLAGTYAFIECNQYLSEENLNAAIKLAEDSGQALNEMLARPAPYERIATYLADQRKEVTEVDMLQHLAFYKGSANHRKDLMNQAIAWGYKNNIIIKTSYLDNIQFFKGESLEKTNLNHLQISYSNDITQNYVCHDAPFDKLHQLVTANGYHYAVHEFLDGYRDSDHAKKGFNLLVLDVDEGTQLSTAQLLLKDYKALFATTKRHQKDGHGDRFRILLPMSHKVELSPDNYRKFMQNVFEWLPFKVDESAKDIARKWESYSGHHFYQDGDLIDALMFIPETRKQEQQQQKILDNAALSNLERWFLINAETGSRNNTLVKYAYVLIDAGHPYDTIRNSIVNFNNQLSDPLSQDELDRTVLVTAMREVSKRDSK